MVNVPWLQGYRAWGDTLDEALRAIPDNIRAMKPVTRIVTLSAEELGRVVKQGIWGAVW